METPEQPILLLSCALRLPRGKCDRERSYALCHDVYRAIRLDDIHEFENIRVANCAQLAKRVFGKRH